MCPLDVQSPLEVQPSIALEDALQCWGVNFGTLLGARYLQMLQSCY
jgi:hypothetical protein